MKFGYNLRDEIEFLIGKHEAPIFAEWAFGKDYKIMHFSGAHHNWNKLHSDKLKLEASGRPDNDLPKMIEIWKKNI